MNKIGMEKENVFRIIVDCVLLFLCLMSLAVFKDDGIIVFLITVPLAFLFSFAIVAEITESIFYDDTHFKIHSLGKTEEIKYADIICIDRVFIREKSVKSGGHWRYYVQIKTQDGILKKISVPFPQVIDNANLQDLFARIKKTNTEVQWRLHTN